jgi:hypothetical protein
LNIPTFPDRFSTIYLEWTFESEYSENDIVPQHVEVPGDDGTFVRDVDDTLVHLALCHWKK